MSKENIIIKLFIIIIIIIEHSTLFLENQRT